MSKKSRTTSKKRDGQIVASRELTCVKAPKRRIEVSLDMPRQVGPVEWQCDIHIDGLGVKPVLDYGVGVDSLQALLMGVEILRLALKQSPHRLAWLGDSDFCSCGGIPQQVGGDLGQEFDERMEQLIEREQWPFFEAKLKFLRNRRLEYLRSRRLETQEGSTNPGERPSSKRRRRSD